MVTDDMARRAPQGYHAVTNCWREKPAMDSEHPIPGEVAVVMPLIALCYRKRVQVPTLMSYLGSLNHILPLKLA